MKHTDDFPYFVDRFADLQVLRYKVPGFENLQAQQCVYIYYLYQAALSGRDITWDQHYKHNLRIRHTLEAIVRYSTADRESKDWQRFMTYTKRVWFSNGIHHHYSNAKFLPDFPPKLLEDLASSLSDEQLPLNGMDRNSFFEWLTPILFDPDLDAKRVSKEAGVDLVQASAVNFYEGVSQAEVETFYSQKPKRDNGQDPSWGLNSKLVKEDGKLVEHTYKVGGLYGAALEKVVYWLRKAAAVAENHHQTEALNLLADYYETGDLETFDAYCVAWLKDTDGMVDTINGFIETYTDPMDFRGTFEALVSIKDLEATKRIQTIADNAQWFEDHSPTDPAHKKGTVKGVSGSVINAVVESGDCHPTTPIGINLPNADWIREIHGSKSVNLANVVEAYKQIKGKVLEEFGASDAVISRGKAHGDLADNLHTDLHEAVGHGSGKLVPGVATPKETLKNYSSTLEESRADLVALYYLLDPYLIEVGLMDHLDVGKACYDDFMTNGLLVQLRRLQPGEDLEEDHMRNRQLIAAWALEHGQGCVGLETREGKTYVVIHDYEALRTTFGKLLKEVQRIKSEGDFEAGKALVERYGVKVDRALHTQVVERFKKLDMANYSGFLNPVLKPVTNDAGEVIDANLETAESLESQMLHYSDTYGFL